LTLAAMQPGRNETVTSRRPTVEADFGRAQADPNTVRMEIDGLNVTDQASRSQRGVVYSPPSDLQFGQHTMRVTGLDDAHRPFDRTWQFTTAAAPVASALALRAIQPEPNSATDARRPRIEAQFAGAQADQNTVRVVFDGLDVSGESTRSPGGIVYSPPSDLQFGQHTVHITGRDDSQRCTNDSKQGARERDDLEGGHVRMVRLAITGSRAPEQSCGQDRSGSSRVRTGRVRRFS